METQSKSVRKASSMPLSIQRTFNFVAIVIYILSAVYRVHGSLTWFIDRRFAKLELGLDVRNDIFLLKNSIADRYSIERLFNEAARPLSPNVTRVEMIWFTHKYPVRYSLLVTSSNPKIMPDPHISPIPTQGVIAVELSKTFEIRFPCSGLIGGLVNVKFVLDYTNYNGTKLDRSSKKTLKFSIFRQCEGSKERTTEATTKKPISRTVVVSISAVLALVASFLVGVVFFWRFVKRIRKKFGFDELTDSLSPVTSLSRQPTNTSISSSQIPTVVYSPKRDRSPNTFFTKITKREETKRERCSTSNADHCTPLCSAPEPPTVNSTNSLISPLSSFDSQDLSLFTRASVEEDEVFGSEHSGMALIGKDSSDATFTLAKESDDKMEMYSTLNEYWATHLSDCLRTRKEIDLHSEVIGEGAFGRVHRGKLLTTHETYENKQYVDVAVKICQDDVEFEQMVAFVNEAILMKSLDHQNLLCLLGVVLQPASPPLILTPFMTHGDLHKFLRHSRGVGSRRQLIGSRQIINFATQIARGMEYLASQKVVHRDLAARNCFVDGDLNVRIGDFGLARKVSQFGSHKMGHPGKVAVKWMALESLLYYIFTEKSDIWSFGIVLWELVTLGSQPYAGLDNYEVSSYLEAGRRLSRPLRCPDDLYAMMCSCWSASPDDRPTFSVLIHKLEDYELRLKPSCIAFEFDEDTIEMADDCDHILA